MITISNIPEHRTKMWILTTWQKQLLQGELGAELHQLVIVPNVQAN